VLRAGHGWTAFKFHDAARHGGLEAAPVRGAEAVWDDEIEILSERLFSPEPEERRRRQVPSHDRPGPVGKDHRVGDLFENLLR